MSLTKPQAQQKAVPWWLVLIEGIALILIGGFLLTSTGRATTCALVRRGSPAGSSGTLCRSP